MSWIWTFTNGKISERPSVGNKTKQKLLWASVFDENGTLLVGPGKFVKELLNGGILIGW
jgi:hypothetical protein